MRRRDLREYGLIGYVRTDAPGEAHTAFTQRFGHEPCPKRTLQYRYSHGLRELLPSEWISEVMPWALPRPEDRFGEEVDFEVTKQESLFPIIAEFPSIIATSKEAQAGIARTTSGSIARGIEAACDAQAPSLTFGGPPSRLRHCQG